MASSLSRSSQRKIMERARTLVETGMDQKAALTTAIAQLAAEIDQHTAGASTAPAVASGPATASTPAAASAAGAGPTATSARPPVPEPAIAPGAVADAMPGAVADAMPGAVADTMPGAVADAMPGAVADTMPGAVADAMPGAVADTMPERASSAGAAVTAGGGDQDRATGGAASAAPAAASPSSPAASSSGPRVSPGESSAAAAAAASAASSTVAEAESDDASSIIVSSGDSMTPKAARLAGFVHPAKMKESRPETESADPLTLVRLLGMVEDAQSVNAAGIMEAFDTVTEFLGRVFTEYDLMNQAFLRTEEAGAAGAAGTAKTGDSPPSSSAVAGSAGSAAGVAGAAAATAAPSAAAPRFASATSEDAGIDWEAAVDGMAALRSSTTEAVLARLATTHRFALDSLPTASLRSSQPHMLRGICICLLSPAINFDLPPDIFPPLQTEESDMLADDQPPVPQTALKPALQLVAGLRRGAKATLVRWFSRMPAKAFERLVEVGHTQLNVITRRGVQVSDLQGAAELLRILNEANEAHCRRTRRRIVPYESLYHHAVSDNIHVESDYERWAAAQRHPDRAPFSFVSFPFLLSPAAKTAYLDVDARAQQRRHALRALADGRRRGILGRPHGGDEASNPYFVIEVSRANIVEETLQRIVNVSPKGQLKKPLKVKFKGEAGVDEGGVRKEFFQVMTRQLFTIDYGMFIEEKETNTLWFNHDSVESAVQWELLGSLLGLAIYNGIILDVQFPAVVYRQLAGEPPTLRDLAEFRPTVASSLQSVLDYDNDDIEDVLCLDFTATYESWGETKTAELIPGGAKVPVTQENKHEYIRLYIKFVLVDLIKSQLGSFKRGFENVASGPIIDMFRPEELELLVVGSKELDFAALRESAAYEDPYTAETPVVQWLWEVVLEDLSDEERKKFLAFTTGSDRAPIRGLGSVRMAVSRAGPDSDHLPTAHTCFSHLLLPEYSSKDKLRTKLKAAIGEFEGFGLI